MFKLHSFDRRLVEDKLATLRMHESAENKLTLTFVKRYLVDVAVADTHKAHEVFGRYWNGIRFRRGNWRLCSVRHWAVRACERQQWRHPG